VQRKQETLSQLLEGMIPNFKREEEKRFYGEIVESYRLAAHDILRESSSINQSGKCHSTRGKKPDQFNEEEQCRSWRGSSLV